MDNLINDQCLSEFLINFIAVIIGALVTWIVAKYYYERASIELAKQAEDLKNKSTLMLRALEIGGKAEFVRDENGDITAMRIIAVGDLKSPPASISGCETE
jgi:uncharacterized ion transporter superfamily protein YfcC